MKENVADSVPSISSFLGMNPKSYGKFSSIILILINSHFSVARTNTCLTGIFIPLKTSENQRISDVFRHCKIARKTLVLVQNTWKCKTKNFVFKNVSKYISRHVWISSPSDQSFSSKYIDYFLKIIANTFSWTFQKLIYNGTPRANTTMIPLIGSIWILFPVKSL